MKRHNHGRRIRSSAGITTRADSARNNQAQEGLRHFVLFRQAESEETQFIRSKGQPKAKHRATVLEPCHVARPLGGPSPFEPHRFKKAVTVEKAAIED